MERPNFLSERDIMDFVKGDCIFCDLDIGSKKIKKEVSKEWRGSEYTEHKVDVLYLRYLLSDLDIYTFQFEFDQESEQKLDEMRKVTLERAIEKRENEAVELESRLEKEFSRLSLSDDERKMAINSVVDDYRSVLKEYKWKSFIEDKKSVLEKDVDVLFHNLRLGDLGYIQGRGGWSGDLNFGNPFFDKDSKDEETDPYGFRKILESYKNSDVWIRELHVSFRPDGLKTHKKCWSFDHFDSSVSFPLEYREFFDAVTKNPRFDTYKDLFKDFPDLLESVLCLSIGINAKTYNPTDYL